MVIDANEFLVRTCICRDNAARLKLLGATDHDELSNVSWLAGALIHGRLIPADLEPDGSACDGWNFPGAQTAGALLDPTS
jgi:hypothetical protein